MLGQETGYSSGKATVPHLSVGLLYEVKVCTIQPESENIKWTIPEINDS